MLNIATFCFANRIAARLAISLLFFACPVSPAHADSLTVSVVLSDSTPLYQQFSVALSKTLVENNANVTIIESQALTKLPGSTKIDLVIAVGMKATEFAVAHHDAPLLSVMIPKMGYEALLERSASQRRSKALSAIYLDQPWERQLDFIQAVFPNRRRIGLLYSPDVYPDLADLRKRIAERGLPLTAQPVRSVETLFNTLEVVLNESDVLLAIPDSAIYNANNMRNILLASYRHKIPMIGISQAYVNAGALCAIFSTSEQLAGQTGEAIISFAKSRQLPEPQYAASFSIAFNQQVARSFGIVPSPPETIHKRMNQAGEGR